MAIGAASVLALTACGGAGGASKQSGSGAAAEVEAGPLEEYFAALWDDEAWTQEKYDQENLRREELIAECMAKEGFEYTPNVDTGGVVIGDGETEGPAWDSLEFAEQYGYGVVDWPGREDIEEITDYEDYTDPNEDYVSSLSESEQNAYYATLYGETVMDEDEDFSFDSEEEAYEYNWEDNGCWGWADHEITSGDTSGAAWEDPEFEELFLAMEDLWSETSTTPDITAANGEWAACMEKAGYPGMTSPDEAQNLMYERQNEIYEAAESPDGEWTEPSPEAFEGLRTEEIALATADWKCKDQVNYTERLQKADYAAQQAFVDAHRDQLEALVAKHGVDSSKKG